MVKTSRRIPPTPVAAPWYGSMYEGWLWTFHLEDRDLSVANIHALRRSLPGRGPRTARCVGSFRSHVLEDL